MVKRAAEMGPDIGDVQYLYSCYADVRMAEALDEVLKHAELARSDQSQEIRFTWLGLANCLSMWVTGTEPYHWRGRRVSAPRLPNAEVFILLTSLGR